MKTEIRKDQGKSLFREMLPILCHKTGNDEWIPQLYEWGKKASVDCNGGIDLGIALCVDSKEVSRRRFRINTSLPTIYSIVSSIVPPTSIRHLFDNSTRSSILDLRKGFKN